MRNLVEVPFAQVLEALAHGIGIGVFENDLVLLDRWVGEAPRKRFYRELKLDGVTVVSGEYWFEDRADGAEIIDSLENSGQLARRILEAFLPAIAFACQQKPHPAAVLYPDP